MPFNLHVGLPGPFSYTRRVGGGPSSAERLAAARAQTAARDLYCPDHLRVGNAIDWTLTAAAVLAVLLVSGFWWAAGLAAVVVPVLRWRQRARHARRVEIGLDLLAGRSGCRRCELAH